MRKKNKILSFLLCFCLLFEQSGFAQVAGQLDISGHINAFRNSFIQDKFRPLHLRSLGYDNSQNNFRLLLDKGDLKNPPKPELESATKTLLNYFFVGITLPNDSFWVNLRPDAEDNIIDPDLAKTDVGKILLEADLQLKKDTARFTSPQTPEGREYWDKLYKKAGELLGAENITIPTLTRPWIVPGEIIIRETKDNAYIYKATLKVMLEQDYLKDSVTYNFKDERLKTLNEYASQLIRENILPKLTKEINTSKRYSPLRQVYYSLILAQWFKSRFYGKGELYSWLIDKRNLQGLTSKTLWSKKTYFNAYQKSFKDGEYNIQQPVYTPYGQSIRSYFSGGVVIDIKIGDPNKVSVINVNGRVSSPLTHKVLGALATGGNTLNPSETEVEITGEAPSLPRVPAGSSPLGAPSVNPNTETRPLIPNPASEKVVKSSSPVKDNSSATELTRLIAQLKHGDRDIQITATYNIKSIINSLRKIPQNILDNLTRELVKLLKNGNPDARLEAAIALGALFNSSRKIPQDMLDKAIKGLLELLKDNGSDAQDGAADGLEYLFNSSRKIPQDILNNLARELVGLLNDGNHDVWPVVTKVLGDLFNSSREIPQDILDKAIKGLVRLLNDEDYYIRDNAASALGDLFNSSREIPQDILDKAIKGLAELLKDNSSVGWIADVARRRASGALKALSDNQREIPQDTLNETIKRLAELLKDGNPEAREEVADVLRIFFSNPLYLEKLDISTLKGVGLESIYFRDGGNSSNFISSLIQNILTIATLELKSPPPGFPALTAMDKNRIDAISSLNDILKGAALHKALGRTLIYKTTAGKFIALKILKENEDPGLLQYESEVFDYLNTLKQTLNLKSAYPTSYLIKGKRIVRIKELDSTSQAALQSQMDKEGNALRVNRADGHYTLMAYEVSDEGYFIYLNDPALTLKQFQEATAKVIYDLFTLARYGIIHKSLIELFHNLIQSGREEGGRYLWMVDIMREFITRAGAGRLHAWPKAVRYPNPRLSGIADAAEFGLLGDIIQPGNVHNPFPKTGVLAPRLQERFQDKTKNIYLASYLGDYLLTYTLLLGSYLRERDQLHWDNKNEIAQYAGQIKDTFIDAYSAFTGKPKGELAPIASAVDWIRLARQMTFFMTKGDVYVEYLLNKDEDFFKKLLGEDISIRFAESFPDSRGWIDTDGKKGWYFDATNKEFLRNFLRSKAVLGQYESIIADIDDEHIFDSHAAYFYEKLKLKHPKIFKELLDNLSPDLGPVNGPLPLQELVKALYVFSGFMVRDTQKQTTISSSTANSPIENSVSSPLTIEEQAIAKGLKVLQSKGLLRGENAESRVALLLAARLKMKTAARPGEKNESELFRDFISDRKENSLESHKLEYLTRFVERIKQFKSIIANKKYILKEAGFKEYDIAEKKLIAKVFGRIERLLRDKVRSSSPVVPEEDKTKDLSRLRASFLSEISSAKRLLLEVTLKSYVARRYNNLSAKDKEDILNIFNGYDSEYDVVTVREDVMALIASAFNMENTGGGLNFDGTVIVTDSTLKKAKERDKGSLFTIEHEHRHNNFRNLRGKNVFEPEEDLNLTEELYAYFSAFINVYGEEALSETLEAQNGEERLPWALNFANRIIQEYIEGIYKMHEERKKEILRVKVIVAAHIVEALIKKYGSEIALEYLKQAAGLDSIMAIIDPDLLTELIDAYRSENTPGFAIGNYGDLRRLFFEFIEKYNITNGRPAAASPLTREDIIPKTATHLSAVNDRKGGVDFRALPIVSQAENSEMPALGEGNLNRLNNADLDSEWEQIQNMVNAGIIPSNERIKEYILAICSRQSLGNQVDKVLGCIADIMRLEEDRVSDADAELKDMLVLIETGRPENELRATLAQIQISPKEPRLLMP